MNNNRSAASNLLVASLHRLRVRHLAPLVRQRLGVFVCGRAPVPVQRGELL
jgi:hypothetical protein